MTTEKNRQKIITAFMDLVARDSWDEISMPAIARAASVKLEVLRATYDSRLAILEDLARRTDMAVLRDVDPNLHEEKVRDRFFEILMLRLDVLTPYKPGLKALARRARRDPLLALVLVRTVFQSQGWMVMAAGLGAEGLQGAVRTKAVTFAYLDTMRVWFEDDEPGLAKTMAALDKALRTAERRLQRLARFGKLVMPGRFKATDRNKEATETGDDAAPAAASG